MRGAAIQLIKLSVVRLLLYPLARNGLLSFQQTARAFSHPLELGAGMVLMVITALLAAYRWHGLLRAQSIMLRTHMRNSVSALALLSIALFACDKASNRISSSRCLSGRNEIKFFQCCNQRFTDWVRR